MHSTAASAASARRAGGRDPLDRVVPGLARREHALGLLPLLEEGGHVAGEVLDDGQVGERPDLEPAVLHHLRDVRAAGPARAAVDRHGAAAAHADAAGEAVGERGVGVALHPGDDVEHGLVLAQRHRVGPIAAVGLAAPERDLDRARPCRLSHRDRHALHDVVAEAAGIPARLERLRLAVGVGGAAGRARARRASRST